MKALIVFGTRPEAIKFASLVAELGKRPEFGLTVCITGQHREMLDQVLEIFSIKPDHDLRLMSPNQSLSRLTSQLMLGLTDVIEQENPDLVLVQGDTTTAFIGALAAFYQKIPVAHVEAGLRTGNLFAPFPEEANRKFVTCVARWHFAPTESARNALLAENVRPEGIHVVGNTVIDALLAIRGQVRTRGLVSHPDLGQHLAGQPFVLITGHRRESFGTGFSNICQAISRLAERHPDTEFVYPVHLNPNVQEVVRNMLSGKENIHLIEPQDYLDFVWLMDSCRLILTDSGGIQEEAPSLGKPVLVMRETTERPEAISAGVALLVGTDQDLIVQKTTELLTDETSYQAMSSRQNPFGSGNSAQLIADVLTRNTQVAVGRQAPQDRSL